MAFYYLFNMFGVIVVFLASLVVASLVIALLVLKTKRPKRKIVVIVAVFLALQVASVLLLLHDFPEPSVVDLAPLKALGAAHIDDFDQKQLALEDTRYYVRNNDVAYNYHFLYWLKPSVQMTIFRMTDAQEAYRNLLVSVGARHEGDIEQFSDTIFAYSSESRMWRGKDTFFDENLSRTVDTYFMIDDTLFVLHETGGGAPCGSTTNEVIDLICDTFFPD